MTLEEMQTRKQKLTERLKSLDSEEFTSEWHQTKRERDELSFQIARIKIHAIATNKAQKDKCESSRRK